MLPALIFAGSLASVLLLLMGFRDLNRLVRQRSTAVRGAESLGADDGDSLLQVADRRFRSTRMGRRLVRELELAGVDRPPIVVAGAGALIAALAVYFVVVVLGAPLLAVFGLLVGWFIVRAFLRRARERRREAFVGQLPEIARVLANASFAGLSLPTAIAIAADEVAEPGHSELQRVSTRLKFGSSLSSALDELNERVGSRETSVLISTLVVSSRAGGSLVTALRDIAVTLDERKETRREIRSILAQPLATSYLVMAMGVVMLLMLNLTRPGTVDKMTRQPIGQIALAISFTIFTAGFLVIRRMTRVDV